MSELSRDEVGHGDEVFDAAIAACPCASLLKRSIHGFDPAVVCIPRHIVTQPIWRCW